MYEEIENDVGSFASSESHDAEAVPLSMLYGAILAQVESLTTDNNCMVEDVGAELDNLLLQLRLWANDIKADTGSLDLLDREYHEEAGAIRIHLQNVSSVLKNLGVEDLSHGTLGDTQLQISFVKDLSLAIHDLAELAEPIQTYVDLHRGHGALSRLKNAIFRREETRHEQDTRKYILGSVHFDGVPKFPKHQQVNTSTVDRSESQRDPVLYGSANSSTDQTSRSSSPDNSIEAQPPTDKPIHEYGGPSSGRRRAVPLDQRSQRLPLPLASSSYRTPIQDHELVTDSTTTQNLLQGIGGPLLSTAMRLSERYHQQFQPHDLPIPYSPGEMNYDSELVIGSLEEQQGSVEEQQGSVEEQQGSVEEQQSSYQDYSQPRSTTSFKFWPQNDAAEWSQDQAPRQLNPQATNFERFSAVQRWSREHAPHERLMLGLPRREFETQHSVELFDVAFENISDPINSEGQYVIREFPE